MRDRGWLTMHGDTFVEFLRRAAEGEDVGILEAEFHANCEVEDYRERCTHGDDGVCQSCGWGP